MTVSPPTLLPPFQPSLQPLKNLPETPSCSEHHLKHSPSPSSLQPEETETQTDRDTRLRSQLTGKRVRSGAQVHSWVSSARLASPCMLSWVPVDNKLPWNAVIASSLQVSKNS